MTEEQEELILTPAAEHALRLATYGHGAKGPWFRRLVRILLRRWF